MSETLFPAPVEGDDDDHYQESDDMTPRKLRRSTAKEELVALTGDFIDAVLLNQMIKYQASCRDRDAYIDEERRRMAARGQILNLPHARGFFYKKADELAKESMVNLHKSNIGKRLKRFEAKGWIEHRRNPNDPFDYVYQYRVDVVEIDKQVKERGFPGLDGWLMTKINDDFSPPENESQRRSSESQLRGSGSQFRSSGARPRSSETDTPSKENKQQQQVATLQATTDTATPSVASDDVVENFAAAVSDAPLPQLDSSGSTTSGAAPTPAPVPAWRSEPAEPTPPAASDDDADDDDEFSPAKVHWRDVFRDMVATNEVDGNQAQALLEKYGVAMCEGWPDHPGKLEEMARTLVQDESPQSATPTSAASLLPDSAGARLVIEKLIKAQVTEPAARSWVERFGATGMEAQLTWAIAQNPRSVPRLLSDSIRPKDAKKKPYGPLFETETGTSFEQLERDEILAITHGKTPGGGMAAEKLDAQWNRQSAETRERLDAQITRKMGAMGSAARGDETRSRMRRQYMADLRAGKQILEESPPVPAVVLRDTGTG